MTITPSDRLFSARRVVGRPAIVRSLRGLLLRVHRFGRHRARSRADVMWSARLLDALTDAVATATADDTAGGELVETGTTSGRNRWAG
jgi:hypothetical protein